MPIILLPLISCDDFLQYKARSGAAGGGGGGGEGGGGGGGDGDGGSGEEVGGLDPLLSLQAVIPGVPGEDYPIYSEVPQLTFSCDGRVREQNNLRSFDTNSSSPLLPSK